MYIYQLQYKDGYDEVKLVEYRPIKFTQFKHKILHSTHIPAMKIFWNKNLIEERWYLNGLIHRKNEPALTFYDINQTIKFHHYVHHGKKHRIDGPAVITYDIHKEKSWFLNGINYSFNEWLNSNDYISKERKLEIILRYT